MNFRKANRDDIPIIVEMIADDDLGEAREDYRLPLPKEYSDSFERISMDANQELIVVENPGEGIVGTMQLTFIPYLTYRGGIRAQIEAVRIRKDQRGKGLGRKMFEWAIQKAKDRNAHLIQLTTNRKRPEAIRFYKEFGFVPTYEGMKLHF